MTQYARSSAHDAIMPEANDDIIVPTLLSVLAHALLIGFIIYTHQTPDLNVPPSIEATMVSPEQLADIQGQILANRAAMAQSGAASSGDPEFDPTVEANEIIVGSANNAASASGSSASRHVPIFMRSDDPADAPVEDGLLLSAEQKKALQEKREAYQREVEKAAALFDQQIQQEQSGVTEAQRQQERERLQRLKELKAIQSKGPMIQKPTRPTPQTAGNKGSNKTTNINFADGDPIDTGSSDGRGSDSAKGGGSSDQSANYSSVASIRAAIKKYYVAPPNTQGVRVRVVVTINSSGGLADINVESDNEAIIREATRAVKNAVSTLNLNPEDSPIYVTLITSTSS